MATSRAVILYPQERIKTQQKAIDKQRAGLPAPWKSWLDQPCLTLLMLASLSVWNGREAQFLSHTSWTLEEVLTLGLLGFSGPGSIAACLQLTGSVARRLKQVLAVYAVVILAAFCMAGAHQMITALMPPEPVSRFLVFSYLLGLGLRIGGFPGSRLGNWSGLQSALQVMLALIMASGIVHVWHGIFEVRLHIEAPQIKALSLALVAGFSLSLIGMFLGLLVHDPKHLRPLRRGAGCSLVVIALTVYLGLPLPAVFSLPPVVLTIGPLGVGLLWTVGVAIRAARPRKVLHLVALPPGR